jgi:hypothetical protein
MSESLEIQVLRLEVQVAALRAALCQAIVGIGSSHGSPLSIAECERLVALASRGTDMVYRAEEQP